MALFNIRDDYEKTVYLNNAINAMVDIQNQDTLDFVDFDKASTIIEESKKQMLDVMVNNTVKNPIDKKIYYEIHEGITYPLYDYMSHSDTG